MSERPRLQLPWYTWLIAGAISLVLWWVIIASVRAVLR